MFADQHDDHCRLVVNGQGWWILSVMRHLVLLTNENGQCVLDTAAVNWPQYEQKAKKMLKVNFP